MLLSWWKSSGHQKTGTLGFPGEESALRPPALSLLGLCVRKKFITAQVWEEAQETLLRKVCEEVKKTTTTTKNVFRACDFPKPL